jgi:PAS domain S-box-containing protein
MMKKLISAFETSSALDPIAGSSGKVVFVRAILWMFVFSIVLFIVFTLLYRTEAGNNRTLRMASTWQSINMSVQFITDELSHAVSDLDLLTRQSGLEQLLNSTDTSADVQLGKQYLALLATHRGYDQARFVDINGMEVVRVNYNDGTPAQVPARKLQDKSERYYFEHTMELDPGQVYMSPFDLNQEYGVLEQPEKPTLRLSTPVSDTSGHKRGLVILNYLGDYLLKAIIKAGNVSGGITWLVNDDGYWLKGPTSDDEWGFMYRDRSKSTIANQYPQAWQHMQVSDEGQIFTRNMLITYRKVSLQSLIAQSGNRLITEPGNYHWIVVSAIPQSVFQADNIETRQHLLSFYGLMLVFVAPFAWLLARLSVRQKTFAAAMARILNNVPVLIAYVDSNQRLRFNNSAYARFFNADEKQLHDLRLLSIVGEKDYEGIRQYVDKALQGEQVNFQQRVRLNDATIRFIDATYLPDINSDGSVRGFIAVINDITELYNAQESEKQRLLELAHAQRVNTMGEMVTEIAHEINQPLTSISNFSSACERTIANGNWDADQLLGWIVKIRGHARRASDVVQRLRTFLRKGETDYIPVDINNLLREVVSWLESDMHEQNILLSLKLENDIPDVMADDILLQQVILNLVRNSIDALSETRDETRKIIIKSRTSGHQVEVSVCDTGPGIPKEIDDRIFYSFITSREHGLGMGLSVSRSIVEAHGGRLYLDSAETTMTTFIFTIPVTQNNLHG